MPFTVTRSIVVKFQAQCKITLSTDIILIPLAGVTNVNVITHNEQSHRFVGGFCSSSSPDNSGYPGASGLTKVFFLPISDLLVNPFDVNFLDLRELLRNCDKWFL